MAEERRSISPGRGIINRAKDVSSTELMCTCLYPLPYLQLMMIVSLKRLMELGVLNVNILQGSLEVCSALIAMPILVLNNLTLPQTWYMVDTKQKMLVAL